MRAIVVDDEPLARQELRYQLERTGRVEVAAEAGSVREARALVGRVALDVVFLDIEMPGASGLEWAQALHGGRLDRPLVVFVTAHDQYAVEAYGLAAVDYCLKPVDPARLARTVERLERLLAGSDDTGPHAVLRFVAGVDGERTVPVPVDQVSYLAAAEDGVRLHTVDGRQFRVNSTLARLEASLPAGDFLRCHRGYVINLRQVEDLRPFFNGAWTVRMKGRGTVEIPVSRHRASALKAALGVS